MYGMFAPVIVETGAQCTVYNIDNRGGKVNIGTVSGEDIKKIPEVIANIDKLQKESLVDDYYSMALRIVSLRGSDSNPESKEDKGIVERISDKEIKLSFEPAVKNKIINYEGNIFMMTLLVDIQVVRIQEKVKEYKVLRIVQEVPDGNILQTSFM